jgi:RHH-type proline utilization regulon transcriptional repressor/proline dehydrogenase/delta 1-pyrroline-5-carboxylate dehydrogenase
VTLAPMETDARVRIRDAWHADEVALVESLIAETRLSPAQREAISADAAHLVREVRKRTHPTIMESFLAEYGLSTDEGVGLMCLAEALLRVPDADTIDELISDKIEPGNWGAHLGKSSSSLVNAATWGLMLTGTVLDEDAPKGPVAALRGAIRRLGEPVIRTAVGQAMRILGDQFVLGETIDRALAKAASLEAKGYTYSYDMLGEAARTEADADRYFEAYATAIKKIAAKRGTAREIADAPGISIKLSALHPRYEWAKHDTVMRALVPRVVSLVAMAADADIGLNIDAEEANRLDVSLDVVDAVLASAELSTGARADWEGFGVVVQAYGRRALPVIDWLCDLAERTDRRLMVRLVKGAYWDTEVKHAQTLGLPSFPVFTRKAHTDISYLACARRLLSASDRIYAQFATHNAHSVAAILAMQADPGRFEFQRLHGMGEALHDIVHADRGTRCRIYAPVGAHEDLLAYLVRRLLENGANSSFVNQIVDLSVPAEEIARDPIDEALGAGAGDRPSTHPAIRPASALFMPYRANAPGFDINEPASVAPLLAARDAFRATRWQAAPMMAGEMAPDEALAPRDIRNPAAHADVVGTVREATADLATKAVDAAIADGDGWAGFAPADRAQMLRAAAQLYADHMPEFCALLAREAGKTLFDAIGDVREAIDFLNYYAAECERVSGTGRGVIVCISPWNFPLAIFTGQIAGALAAGNRVIAKPAEQTPLIAARAVALLREAGIPGAALQLLPGDGPTVGAALVSDPRIAGVCFTGSTGVAQLINRTLAENAAPDAALIAETGGLNAMIVDSTALPEQAVRDIVASAFQSAGQRCSALRILYVQDDIADRLLDMLTGAMWALDVGDPWTLATDIGPVIDSAAQDEIRSYIDAARDDGRVIAELSGPAEGTFVAPTLIEVGGIADLEREIFGPVLHVARFKADDLDRVIDDVNGRGYGLTFGLHSRIDDRVERLVQRVAVGNIYVNRNQIGAVVGSQPFGGEGLSGTGPKAGGPHYVARLTQPVVRFGAGPKSSTSETGGEVDGTQLAEAWRQLVAKAPARRSPNTSMAMAPDAVSRLATTAPNWAADAIAAAARLTGEVEICPGPTGESNDLRHVPRGAIVVIASNGEQLAASTAVALAAGNSVLAIGPGGDALAGILAGGYRLGHVSCAASPDLAEAIAPLDPLAGVAVAPSDDAIVGALRRELARREGAIVPLITDILSPERFVLERHVCIDTTASGGNAALLAAVE